MAPSHQGSERRREAVRSLQADPASLPSAVRPFNAVLLARWRGDARDLRALPALLEPGGVALIVPEPGHEQARPRVQPCP